MTRRPNSWLAKGFSLRAIIAQIYNVEETRLIAPAPLDAPDYDFAGIPPKPLEELRDKLGLVLAKDRRNVDMLVVQALS